MSSHTALFFCSLTLTPLGFTSSLSAFPLRLCVANLRVNLTGLQDAQAFGQKLPWVCL